MPAFRYLQVILKIRLLALYRSPCMLFILLAIPIATMLLIIRPKQLFE